ncbi:MAG: ABC transporter ATP-binding protein/permease [Clostridiales bacterium]|jgi:ATP-binding cassette subfamily B protein|nr:ABC transporter ATP-binding protein/permease [Clostridiales bacterium]
MPKLQQAMMLTDDGYRDLKKAIFACTLTNFSMLPPFFTLVQFVAELLRPFTGGAISPTKLWILFGAGIVSAFLTYLCQRNDYRKTYVVSYTQSKRTRVAVAEHIRRLPMSVFNSKNLSDLTSNIMADVANSEHALSHLAPQLIANGVSITVTCALLAIYDWRMALAMFITMPVSIAVVTLSEKIYGRLAKRFMEAKLDASDRVQEYIDGIKVIRACNMDGERFEALRKALREMMRNAMKFELGAGVFIMGAQTILQAGIGITTLAGTTLLTGGRISFESFTLFLIIAVKIYGPVITLLTLLPELFYFRIGIRRIRDLMAIETMDGDKEKDITSFGIVFEHVDFSYNKGETQTIRDLNLTIQAGGITALVGPSGGGKSTILKLIARFWDADRGKISIGGVNVKYIDPERLMGYMSFVFQDVTLFNDTVLGNIKIGDMDATEERARAAAKVARCDDFVNKLPEGYNTTLGENGATLSGGERQRISIARALLKDAPIILLDEATASLDPENEAAVQEAISALIEGKTVVVIAHSLRSVMGADKIAVLDKGRLFEQGTGEELLAKNGLFAKLYDIQRESLNWTAKK